MPDNKSAQESFDIAVRAYSGDLYRFAYWQCRDRFLAEDMVQETFARAWISWHQLKDYGAMKSWLFTILRHEVSRWYERKRFDIDRNQDVDALAATTLHNPVVALEVREALQALSANYREPLLLQVLGGFSCRELSTLLSITETAVMTRLSRARSALRRLIEPRGAKLEKKK